MDNAKKYRILQFVWENLQLTRSQLKKISMFLGKCEDTGLKCIPVVHRVKRGYQGGKYILANLKFISAERHKEYHKNEPGIRNR